MEVHTLIDLVEGGVVEVLTLIDLIEGGVVEVYLPL